jgi:ABC-type transport system substrate-binding protein
MTQRTRPRCWRPSIWPASCLSRKQTQGLAFTLLSSDDPALMALAADLAAQWSLLGIQVSTESVSQAQLRQRLENGQFDAALVELSFAPSADPDPYTFWHQGQYGEGQNYGGVNDRLTSELLENARRDPNGLHRLDYYTAFQQAFVDRSLALLLYYPAYSYAITARLEGIQLGYLSTPADRFRNVQAWTLNP